MDESAAPIKGPRFPWLAALLCAASLGAAAWTWMRYSYAWEVAPERLAAAEHGPLEGYYLALRGKPIIRHSTEFAAVERPVPDSLRAYVRLRHAEKEKTGTEVTYRGRAGWRFDQLGSGHKWLVLDTNHSRFHGASLTGLAVGAMGVAVFVMCLRTWLKERRAGQDTAG